MKIALAGRPGSGKSTLFDLLAGPHASHGLRIAHVDIPDPRLDALSASFKPKKTIPARLELWDLEQKSGPNYPALSSERRDMLSKSELILFVLALFATDPEDWLADAKEQIREVRDELVILDMTTVEARIEKVDKIIRSGQKPGFPGELELLKELHELLQQGRPILDHPAITDRERDLRGFAFLTVRPILPAFNVAEEHLEGARAKIDALPIDEAGPAPRLVLGAEVERQIQELAEADRREFLGAFGLTEPALAQTLRAAYARAGLQSFFTVGEDEVRAWSVRKGSTAPQAAGVIHTDLEKGFVRAEVLAYTDWVAIGSMSKAKDQGKLRLEGKDYVVQDGDILNIRSGLAKGRG